MSHHDEMPLERKIGRTLHAIGAVAGHLSDVKSDMGKVTSSIASEVAVDVRSALEQADRLLFRLLDELSGKIWGLLPDDVREDCRQAGMKNWPD